MQKLRQLYSQTQNNAKNSFDKVTPQRCRKILAFANKQYQTSIAQNDFGNLEEIAFYQQKFSLVSDKFNNAVNDKTKKSKIQTDIVKILSENYALPGVMPNTPQSPYIQNNQHTIRNEERQQRPKQKKTREMQEYRHEVNNLDPKEMLSSYFDMKKNEIQSSKIGFRSVLENIPKASHKYNVRSNLQAKKNNDEDILKYKKQVDQLSKKLQQSKMQTKLASEFRHGIVQAQKQQYQARIQGLVRRIEKLNRENDKIKHQCDYLGPQSKFATTSSIISPITPNKVQSQQQKYDPFTINYRPNDIYQINQKHQSNSYIPHIQKSSQNHKQTEKPHKASEYDILLKAFPQQYMNENPKYQSQFQKSNLKFNKSQVENEQKNIIIRSKLSFFKSTMVLFRSQQFQIALKSHEIVPLQSRKITFYINNKDKFERKVQFIYNYDPSYYQIVQIKKLSQVEGLRQGKEQIEVNLKNKIDLDSLVQAKLTINNKTIKFIIPTMMIEFIQDKPNISSPKLEKKVVSRPMHQFSTIFSAMEIIPLEKYYQQMLEVGRVYARSKYHQGPILLRWKDRNEIQIETIKPWVLFLSYLMIKDY